MSSESPPGKTPKPRASARPKAAGGAEPVHLALRAFDVVLLAAFLALTFLLGAFPLKDTDFWWHLRTGDLIRQTGAIPRVDSYIYTVEGRRWVDLHWVFQVAVSWVYERGGVPALTLAKCAVTTLAVLLLVTAKRREWPYWAVLTAWLPALLVLGGRMYVRPETLTLLYLSIYLAVLTTIDRVPALALVLPAVQVAWVNTQGLFVFGPMLFAFALLDAVTRPGAFAPSRKRWWRLVVGSVVLTGLACLVNPYGLVGALYPIELARTMSNQVFSDAIAELTPLPLFIQRGGLVSLPLRLQLYALVLGALSFLVPLCWVVLTRLRPAPGAETSTPAAKPSKPAKRPPKPAAPAPPAWQISPFRLLLFAAFSLLSWRATRNSHQFAAVVGSVTAWNLAEWAAAVRRRARQRLGPSADRDDPGRGVAPRLAALVAIAGVFAWVATGSFYAAAREGRTIGLGEEPLWYPHEAVKFAGGPGMPPRFLGFHIGHPSLYEYYFSPERKVYADARLEVIGADLFERYMALQARISKNDREYRTGWPRELDEIGRPVVLADHENDSSVSGALLTSADWRCVWFDPVAAVFVHASHDEVVRAHQVDFAARHFRPEPATDPKGTAALLASAKGLRNVAMAALVAGNGNTGRVFPLVLLGMAHARRVTEADPRGAERWKMLGQLEQMREPSRDPTQPPVPRFRMPFDPVFDLSAVRATYALSRAAEAAPEDFTTLVSLQKAFEDRGMVEAMLGPLDRLVALTPVNVKQAEEQGKAGVVRASIRAALGPPAPSTWRNRDELNRTVAGLLAAGRAAEAADMLERAAPSGARTWEEADLIATLRLHLGEPQRARALWESAPEPPRPAVRSARVAVTHLVEGAFDTARQTLRAAIAADPELFEAHYVLAVLEQDAGRAGDALNAARRAVATAPTDYARSTTQAIVSFVTPYALPPIAR
jgi:tetratricopeptide (TPR) repeat protein